MPPESGIALQPTSEPARRMETDIRMLARNPKLAICLVSGFIASAMPVHAAQARAATLDETVERIIRPLMARYAIPGMAIGVIHHGVSHVYNYGIASKATGEPVSGKTLFEIGSISKTFTATLASYAEVRGHLSLSDPASKYLSSLRGSSFDKVSLLNLGTHTSGGMPAQVPDEIATTDQLMSYFRNWKPPSLPGTVRTYANPSIGLLGMVTAASMNESFVALMEGKLFPAIGMSSSFLVVPKDDEGRYAQGYTKSDRPIRMAPGVLAAEAYGIRTTASDMTRFVAVNMRCLDIDEMWQRAVMRTHTGYFQVGGMTQDLIWEQYPYPTDLDTLLAGNSTHVSAEANPVTPLDPPSAPKDDVLLDKTGSTNGFAAYVAFVPARKLGVVLLANKNYPIDARVMTGYQVLKQLDDDPQR